MRGNPGARSAPRSLGNMKKRLLIAEPQRLLAQGLAAMLAQEADFELVGCAASGEEAVQLALQQHPELLLIELDLPGLNGIETISTLKRQLPSLQTLVLTHMVAEVHVREALSVGATGYVLKDAGYEDLIHALRSVARGKRYLSSDVASQVVNRYLRPHEQPPETGPSGAVLTRRERGILQLIAQGHTNRTAAGLLQLSPKTIEKHRANVMRKLQVGSVSELTLAALEMGLIQRPSVARGKSNKTLA